MKRKLVISDKRNNFFDGKLLIFAIIVTVVFAFILLIVIPQGLALGIKPLS